MIFWPLLLPPLGWMAYTMGAHLLTVGCVRRGPRDKRSIALTFDDGPDPDYTPELLRALARAHVRATFFLVGKRALAAPEVVKAIVNDGHEVGSHSWSHRHLWWSTPSQTREEVSKGALVLSELTGRAVRFFRPPWGMVNLALFPALRSVNARCVFWSIQPEGLRPSASFEQVDHVLSRSHPGAIVDLHDAEGLPGAPQRLLAALPMMIERLRAEGYALVTLGELLSANRNGPSRPGPTGGTISRVIGNRGSGEPRR
ncbi:MAG TPA: polysaccharide deacetylase family protein [Methylomirabilota bacterium]|nr:polysaccharide deacetylase family protein [Methylomirabilota bacterium]